MSIVLNDNLKIEAPKLIDERFGPHANLGAALAFITPALREMGLIFFVKDGVNLLEYWWPTTDLSDGGIALRSYQPLDADLTAIANIIDGGTGFLKKTAPNTWSLDTTVVTASTVAGGELEGYYPNPTLKNISVINKVLSGFNTIGGGTIVDGDSILVAFGKVQNQLNALYGGMQFVDFWDASSNTPTIPAASLSNKGNYYIVQVAGSTNIGGITDWKVGDWLVSNGSVWSKIDNTDAVISVNGYTGAVTLTTSDIAEGTNLYYTDLRVKTYADTLYSPLGHTHTFASLTSKPTTVSGYGITDAYTKTEIENFFGGVVGITGYNKNNWDAAFGWGNHALAGYVKGTGVAQRIPYFSSTDTVTTSSRFIWDTALNALVVNSGIAGTIGATLSGAFDGGSLQVWNGHEFAVMGSNVGNSGDVATMIMKSNRGISTANGYIEIQGYYAGGTNNAPIILQRQGGVIIIGGITAGTDTSSLLQVGGAIRQTSVTSALLKASATGILQAAVAGTDYLTSADLSGYYTQTQINNFFAGTTAITGYNKSNWDTAFGWGNHAGLYSLLGHTHDDRYYTETEIQNFFSGASAITGYNKSNWDTVYSWYQGNPLSGYLPLSGGSMSGKIISPATGADVYGGSIELRERGYVLETQSDWSYAPGITLHWGNRYAIRFGADYLGNLAVDNVILATRPWVTSTGDSRYLMGTTNPGTVNNFTISIGNNGSYSYVQSHSSMPLELNPLGNTVRIAGNIVLHAGNYGSYALPLSGGTLSGIFYSTYNTASGRSNLSFNVAQSVLGNIHIQNGAGPSNSANQAAITFMGGSSTQAQAGIYVLNDGSNGTSMGFATTDSYAVGPQLFMTAANSGVVNFVRTRPTALGNIILDAGNFTSYALSVGGGTITTNSDQPLTINKTSGSYWNYIGFSYAGSRRGYFGLEGAGNPVIGSDTGAINMIGSVYVSSALYGNQILARRAQTAGSYTSAALWTESYDNTTTGIAFHISGVVGKFLEMRTDQVLYWNGDVVLHSGNANYAWNMNQYVRTTDDVTFNNIYVNSWFRNNTANTGLYNQANNTWFYSSSNFQWDFASAAQPYIQIGLRPSGHGTSATGYIYSDTSANTGFLNSSGSWSLRVTNAGDVISTSWLYPSAQTSYGIYMANSGIWTNNNLGANADIYLGTRSVWLSAWLDQAVRTDSSPTFGQVYNNGWFRNVGVQGLYNGSYGNHWYASSDAYWNAAGNHASVVGIVLRTGGHEGAARGYVYANSSNEIGFLRYDGNWSLRCDGSFNVQVYGAFTANGGGFNSDLTLKTVLGLGSDLNIADSMRLIRYKWSDVTKDQTMRYGYGAQWVEELIPEAVYRISDGTLAVDYTQVHTVLIDENTRRIRALEAEVAELKRQLNIA